MIFRTSGDFLKVLWLIGVSSVNLMSCSIKSHSPMSLGLVANRSEFLTINLATASLSPSVNDGLSIFTPSFSSLASSFLSEMSCAVSPVLLAFNVQNVFTSGFKILEDPRSHISAFLEITHASAIRHVLRSKIGC